MIDLIDRKAAVLAATDAAELCHGRYSRYRNELIEEYIGEVPTADVIPIAWIEKHIAQLEELDNEFANLTAMNIKVMVNNWKEDAATYDDEE